MDGSVQRGLEIAVTRQTGIGLVEGAGCRRVSVEHVVGMLPNQRLTRMASLSSLAGTTPARSNQLASRRGSPGLRLRKNRMPTTTSVPASARKLRSGKRIAAMSSADLSMCSRAVASALSIVPDEVTKAASAPGLRKSIDGR